LGSCQECRVVLAALVATVFVRKNEWDTTKLLKAATWWERYIKVMR
jgi:hypothetical protein